jgi:DsbC/DsbD-like thiol-disulfide interchange protein
MMRVVLFPFRQRIACAGVVALACAFAGGSARAGNDPVATLKSPHVRAELIADVAAIQPGTPFRLGVRLKMDDHWHVNWINPGDAGLAPSVAWKLPAGFKAGIVQWPLPARFITGPLVIFGYAGDVLLMTDVRVPADLAPGTTVKLDAGVSWLACADECVPGSDDLHLELPVEANARTNQAEWKQFETTSERLPGHTVTWNIDAYVEESNTLVLEIQSGTGGDTPLQDAFFFPYDPGLIENAMPQVLSLHPGGTGQGVYQLRIARARMPVGDLRQVYGLLVASSGLSAGDGPAAIEINVPLTRR